MYIEVSRAYTDKVTIFFHGTTGDTAPEFTREFKDGLVSLQKAAKDPESNKSKQRALDFIHDFGTHFLSESYLGATQVVETVFHRGSKSERESEKRSRCVNKAFQNGARKGIATQKVDISAEAGVEGFGVVASTELGGDGWSTSESEMVSALCYLVEKWRFENGFYELFLNRYSFKHLDREIQTLPDSID